MAKKKEDKEKEAVIAEEAAAQVAFEAEEVELAGRRAQSEVNNAARIAAAEHPKSTEDRLRHAISLAITALEAPPSPDATGQALRILRSA